MINSILDSDMYKFTQQQAVLEQFPDVDVEYVFTNRDLKMKFTEAAVEEIRCRIDAMASLQLSPLEYEYIKNLRFVKPMYAEYLRNYRFDPSEVHMELHNNNLFLNIKGKWHSTI